jgi:hypothetical protein
VQILGEKNGMFVNSAGDTYIIPIKIMEGTSPTVLPAGTLLQEGKRLCVKKNEKVQIEPGLRLLFVLL